MSPPGAPPAAAAVQPVLPQVDPWEPFFEDLEPSTSILPGSSDATNRHLLDERDGNEAAPCVQPPPLRRHHRWDRSPAARLACGSRVAALPHAQPPLLICAGKDEVKRGSGEGEAGVAAMAGSRLWVRSPIWKIRIGRFGWGLHPIPNLKWHNTRSAELGHMASLNS